VALPLASADNLTRDEVFAGIVEETIEEDFLLERLPFETISGFKQVTWNKENSLGGDSQWISVNEEVQESAPTWTSTSQALSILADRIELDRFLVETKDAVQPIEASALAGKMKQMLRAFSDNFYYGSNSSNANQYNGLHNLVSTSSPDMVVAQGSGSTGAAGTLTNLTDLLTRTRPGKPDVAVMNRNLIRRLSAPYISNVQYNVDAGNFGNFLTQFAQVPIAVTDWLSMTETISGGTFSAKAGGATASILAMRFGKMARQVPNTGSVYNVNGILGIQAGPMQIGERHPLEKKIAFSRQVWWYHTVIQGTSYSLARMDGITDAAFTA
jgi:hypothetical protein